MINLFYRYRRLKKHIQSSSFWCRFFHDWSIRRLVSREGRFVNYGRICTRCQKMEELRQSNQYPFDFVWDKNPAPMHNMGKKPIQQRVSKLIKRLNHDD